MARFRPDIEQRRSHAQNVVNLAGMDDANEGIAHDYQVQVRRGKGPGQFAEWLVGPAGNIGQPMVCRELLDPAELRPSAHKTKGDFFMPQELFGRGQDSVQWMAGAVV